MQTIENHKISHKSKEATIPIPIPQLAAFSTFDKEVKEILTAKNKQN
jgi:hypothetical protein